MLSWQDFETDQQTASDFDQIYNIDWIKSVSEPTSYHLWLRANDSTGDFTNSQVRTNTDFLQLQLGGEITINSKEFRLLGRYNDISTYFGSTDSRDRDLETGRLLLGWMPESLPDLTLEAVRQDFFDRPRAEDRTDSRERATLFEDFGAVQASLSLRQTEVDDSGLGSARETEEIQGNLLYADTYWSGRVTASGRLAFNATELDERGTGTEGGGLREPIQILTAASGIDETPANGRDDVLRPTPGLIDGAFVPIGIALGPTGETFVNVALDLTRTAEVGEVLLYVRDPSGDLVRTGGPLEWTVYTSLDKLDWVPLTGVAQRFDSGRSLYELTFESVPTRFLKVVSFGLNVVDTELVEVETFEISLIGPGERRRSDLRTTTGVVALNGRITERVQGFWSGRWNRFRRQPEGGEEIRTDDDDHTVGLVIEPTRDTNVTLRYRHTGQTQTDSFDRNFDEWRLNATYAPRTGLNLTLDAARSEDDAPNREVNTQLLALRGNARLLRAVDIRLDVGESENEVVLENETVTRRFVNGYSILRLTKGLQATATINRIASDVEEDLLPGQDPLSLPSETRWSIELYWRGGAPLALTGRYGQVRSGGFSTDTRTLNVQWTPFQGGNIYLTMAFDENFDSVTRRAFRRLLIAPRWNINRHTTLNLNYTVFEFGGASNSSQRTAAVNLSYRL